MNNRQIASPESKATQNAQAALHGKSSRADDSQHDPHHRDFWEAFTFSDGFEDAFYQEAPFALAPSNAPQPLQSEAPDSSQNATPSQWQPLQCELIEAMDNICAPPFAFSLQLPQLGDIDARLATLVPRGWDISLRFSRESYHQLKDRREACRHSLSSALDCPINLRFDAREYER
ncbi:type III secretion system HrpP C-terminal domain-containing protein [Pectobacterium odoriferum]|uniref:type III secretion system HrpP C-terminal domain-containing protein n=1 Tax=Pectobacterium odoriferum TaxID=78398 RepID=UPI001CF545B3|nr:type III secretion system HrpP C-terminal domain-containing protein [Pectobacterium odoriferum]MCA6962769.1 type III secretion system HrpP C-terminal domain-containing protein [Pectobacterium odoriferum]MCH5010862.1 type III secretion protein [Pectobacterium odoriferum]